MGLPVGSISGDTVVMSAMARAVVLCLLSADVDTIGVEGTSTLRSRNGARISPPPGGCSTIVAMPAVRGDPSVSSPTNGIGVGGSQAPTVWVWVLVSVCMGLGFTD